MTNDRPAAPGAACSALLILLVIVVLPISALTPPFQSPDEFNHLKRAYLLSKGEVLLSKGRQFFGAAEGETGGKIDGGLLEYMSLFERVPFRYQEKVTQQALRDSREITWSADERFSSLPNSAVYFPAVYLPQAAALVVGEHSGLSVADTYYLARALSLASTIALLWIAMRLYGVPLPVYALFCMPMAIFQMGSASQDAVSFGLCVLAAALFMRAADSRLPFSNSMHVALVFSLFVLATARTNLIAVVWLPLVLYWIRGERRYLLSSGVLLVLCLGWTVFAALTIDGAGMRIQYISPARLLFHYLTHLGELLSVISATLTSGTLLLGYWRMFVGVLGWIDTPLDWAAYWAFAATLLALAITAAQTDIRMLASPARVALALGAFLSTGLLFLIFLVTFTLYPANFIGAIQGRYFYPMAIFLGFALFAGPTSPSRDKIGRIIVISMLALSSGSMVPKLLSRFWAA